MSSRFQATARIYVLKTEEGGRQSAAFSGYRPNLTFDQENYFDCVIYTKDKEDIHPGEHVEVILIPHHPEYMTEHLKVGEKFCLTEGHRIVARGEFTGCKMPAEDDRK